VTLIQRFGSAANLNIHLHCLVLDGVYRTTGDEPEFYPVRAPTIEQLQALLLRLIQRLMRLLTRLGYLVEEEGMSYLASPEVDPALGPLHAASCTYRIALGPRAGQKVVRLPTATALTVPTGTPTRCVELEGFSLHAETRCAINQRHKLEQLCRYITRPAIANERLSVNETGQIVLKLKTPYREGTTQIVMEPLESEGQDGPVSRPEDGIYATPRRPCPASSVASHPLSILRCLKRSCVSPLHSAPKDGALPALRGCLVDYRGDP
jgi:hypothetical protein